VPEELSVGFDPELEVSRVFRGGSWFYTADYARAACRSGNNPGDRRGSLGFRIVRDTNHEGERHEKEG
jgi:formylglycine-generating enzyme required for sulfatase activity